MDELVALLGNSGIVAALLEATKRAVGSKFDWTRFGAWLAIATGVGTSFGAYYGGLYPPDVTPGEVAFAGILAGITASGLNRTFSQSAPTVVVQGEVPGSNQPATAEVPLNDATSTPGPLTRRQPPSTDD